MSEAQPATYYHGRAVAVTVAPAPAGTVVVASESGGLFQSADYGQTWDRPASLPMFRMRDVKYGPAVADGTSVILVATGYPDSSYVNQGGIWVSTDNGVSWGQVGYVPLCTPPGGTLREGAYGIGIDPVSGNVYVGTDCGLAYSYDNGSSWTEVNPNPGASDSRIFSVSAQGGNIVDVYGAAGHFRGTVQNGGSISWTSETGAPQSSGSVHSLAASPVEPGVLFVADSQGYVWEGDFYSNGSHYWVKVSPVLHDEGSGATGRAGWVAASPSVDGSTFYLYYGAGENWVYEQTIHRGLVGPRCSVSGWTQVAQTTHKDPNGMAFSTQPGSICPVYLVSDGGIAMNSCSGLFVAMGSGQNDGYNALQIYHIAGEMVSASGASHTELYLAAQDNGIFASGDDGDSWPANTGGDDWYPQVARYSYGLGHQGDVLTYMDSSGAIPFNKVSGPLLQQVSNWQNPRLPGVALTNTPVSDNPTLVNWKLEHHTEVNSQQSTLNTYIQYGPGNNVLEYAPSDAGSAFFPVVTNVFQWLFWPKPSSTNGLDTVFYQPYKQPGGTVGLLRITGIRTDGTWVNPQISPATNGLGNIGVYNPGESAFVTPIVFGVDPADPSHLIAPDIGSHSMKVSRDGGSSWVTDAGMTQLTELVEGSSQNGFPQYRFDIAASEFYNGIVPPGSALQVSAIGFDPNNLGHILVGTEAAGLFRSTDGGNTWTAVAGTRNNVTAVTGFFFNDANVNPNQPQGEVWIATYGRGLWKMTYPPIQPPGNPFQWSADTEHRLDTGCWLQNPSSGQCLSVTNLINPVNCAGCITYVNDGGNITDISLDTNGILQSITTDTGRVVASSSDGQPVAPQHPILTSDTPGQFVGCPACSNLVAQGGTVQGVVLQYGALVAILGGSNAMPGEAEVDAFSPAPGVLADLTPATAPTAPYIQLAGTIAVGGQPTATSGDSVTLTGSGFCGSCDVITVSIDSEVVTNIVPNADGSFQAAITISEPVGDYTLTAQQDSPSRTLADAVPLVVIATGDTDSGAQGLLPTLTIQSQTNGLLITWSGDNYVLQSNTNSLDRATWQPVPDSQVFNIGDLNAVLVQPVGPQAFYRLALAPAPVPPAAPSAVTQAASAVTTTTVETVATLNGTVNGKGGDTSVWFLYGTTINYDNAVASTSISVGDTNDEPVNAFINQLSPSTLYHFEVVAANAGGTTYGGDQTFVTPAIPPDAFVQTFAASNVTSSSTLLTGNANPEGTELVGWFQWGTTTSYGNNTADFYNSTMNFQSAPEAATITGLQPSTTYHYRIVAFNGGPNEALGNDVTFTTSASSQPQIPTVNTLPAGNVGGGVWQLNGNVNPNGADTQAYFEYGSNAFYGSVTGTTDVGSGGSVVGVAYALNLAANTTYHYRVVAYNSGGTSLGSDQSFATGAGGAPPGVSTTNAFPVSFSSAQLNGYVNPNGGDTAAWFQFGLETNYPYATPAEDVGSGTTWLSFSSLTSTGLTANTTYHFRIVASNSGGTSYGQDVPFTTAPAPLPPTVATTNASSVGTNYAFPLAYVSPNGLDTQGYFQFGLDTNYGSTTAIVDLGSGSTFRSYISFTGTGLLPNTTYHCRVIAFSSAGTSYGQDVPFTTLPLPPSVTTGAATAVGFGGATLNATINPNGGVTTAWFLWGTTTNYGFTTTPTGIGSAQTPQQFSAPISGLADDTVYHCRAAASNAGGTTYGADVSFNTATQ